MSEVIFAPFVKHEDATYVDVAPLSGRFAKNEGYLLLAWRKFRRSVTGMIGLILVWPLLIRRNRLWLSRRQTPLAFLTKQDSLCARKLLQ